MKKLLLTALAIISWWVLICICNYTSTLNKCGTLFTDSQIQNCLYECGYTHNLWESPGVWGWLCAPARRVLNNI